MTEYKTKTFTIDAWPVGDVTPDDIPPELTTYVEEQRLIFLSTYFEVVNVTGPLLPEEGDYLVLEDHNLYFIDPAELDVMFENMDSTPILPDALYSPRERRVDLEAKAKLKEKLVEKEEKEEKEEEPVKKPTLLKKK